MIQSAQGQQGLPQSTSVIGSSDATTTQMLALARYGGRALAAKYPWVQLQRSFTWTLNAVSTTGTLTSGSPTITAIPSTASLAVGYAVTVSGFTTNARIIAIASATSVTVSENATASATATDIVFPQEAYQFPGDFSRFINRTQWDRNYRWELIGPLSPQEWEWRKSGIIASSPRRRFRIIGQGINQIFIDPLPGASATGQILVFEYYTDNFCLPRMWVTGTSYVAGAVVSYNGYWYTTTAGGTSGAVPPTWLSGSQSDGTVTWTFSGYNIYGPSGATLPGWKADTDIGVLPEDLLSLDVIWRFRKAKGFPDWQMHQETAEAEADRAASKLKGAPTLTMSQRRIPMFITPANVPDSGFGGVNP